MRLVRFSAYASPGESFARQTMPIATLRNSGDEALGRASLMKTARSLQRRSWRAFAWEGVGDGRRCKADVLRDLNRLKVLFQARTIAAVMGLPLAMQAPKSNQQQGDDNGRITSRGTGTAPR